MIESLSVLANLAREGSFIVYWKPRGCRSKNFSPSTIATQDRTGWKPDGEAHTRGGAQGRVVSKSVCRTYHLRSKVMARKV